MEIYFSLPQMANNQKHLVASDAFNHKSQRHLKFKKSLLYFYNIVQYNSTNF